MPKITLAEAHNLHLAGNLQLAEKYYNELLSAHPDEWATLFFYGGLALQTERNGLAIALLEKSLKRKPEMCEGWNNLGVAYRKMFHNDKAKPCFLRALSIRENEDSYNNLGTIHVNEGSPAEGEGYLRKAIAMAPNFVQAHWNLALTLLEQGKYKEGFEHYAWGLKSKDRLVKHYDCGWWRGQQDGRVVVYGEQGIGDEIMFFSMIPDMVKHCKEVVLDCHPRLAKLFERSFGVKCFPTRKEVVEWHWEYPVDYKVAAGNLGAFWRPNVESFSGTPYLKPDPDMVEKMKAKLAGLPKRLNVGITWRGGKHKTKTAARSIPLGKLLTAFEGVQSKVNLISFQYDEEADAEVKGSGVVHWPEIVRASDYDEIAALTQACDLIITVNNSMVHTAGAIGKECWVLTPVRKAWRYYTPDGTAMPWYKSCRIVQQQKDGDWNDVIAEVRGMLSVRLEGE